MIVKDLKTLERFDSAKMTKVNLFETSRFFCDVYCLLPGQEQKIHSHAENDKIYCILRGEAKVTVGKERQAIGPGRAVLAPAGEAHGIANESSAELVCLVFMAPHPGLKS